MRAFFLFLSRQKQLRRWMETSSLAKRLSTRFVAGETLDQALAVARRLNAEGITVTLDHLGESVTSLAEAAEARDIYLCTLDAIHGGTIHGGTIHGGAIHGGAIHSPTMHADAMQAGGVQGNVSLKLTQFGIDLSYEQCLANVEQLVRQAAGLGSFVRVDMESSEYADRTLKLVTTLHARHGAVGVVIQAYLYRSKGDIEKLCAEKIRVRLCKGAYLEPATVAFPRKADVDHSYVELTQYLLKHGVYPAIATHDEAIIEQTKRFVKANGIGRDCFEFQMLYGIRRDLQRRLVAEGYRLRLYVPFGKAWYPYYMRRLAERPANVFFMLRNLFRA